MVLTHTRTTPRDPNKFPTLQLFLLALVRVAEPIAITSIFPYAWQLVLHFRVGDKSNASFYAGLLVSAFSFTESLTGMYWGGLSDKIGRKPVLLMGCLGTIASLLVVGFSMNFWMALFGRLLGGVLNGNVGVIQTMVGELVVNPKHEPKAYAVMPFVWSVGTILGPSIGGYFASPAETFPGAFSSDGIFGKFPYLLPNLICAGLMLISIIAGYLCLEETHPDMQPWSTTNDCSHRPAETPIMPAQAGTNTAGADLTRESYGTFNDVSEEAVEEEWDVKADGTCRTPSIRSESGQKVFTKRVVLLTIALGIFTYHSMTYDHLMPIFFQDKRVRAERETFSAVSRHLASDLGSFAGGLGLSVQDVGVIMSVQGLIALAAQALVFPLAASWLGVWKVFILVTVLHPIAYFIVPFLALLPGTWLYAGIYACLTVRNVLSILAYPVLLILIKEASPAPSSLGKINGLAASTGAACRTIASPIAGLLYGVGINIKFTPLAWWASALVAVVGAVQVFFVGRVRNGPQHSVRSALIPEQNREHRPSVVRIRVHENGERRWTGDEERRPLFASRVE